jgi:hypothetical protein
VGIIGNLENALKEFARSDKFKDKVKAQMKKSGSSISNVAKQSAEWYAERMQEIVRDKMDQHGIDLYAEMRIESVKDENGTYRVEMYFDNDSNLSPSLYEKKWGSVVLPRLLNKGWDAGDKKMASGIWRSKSLRKDISTAGLKKRDAIDFLADVVKEFNSKYGDVAIAEWQQLPYRDE